MNARRLRTEATTAMVLTAPRRLERRELPVPTIGDDDALLRVEACGLCGTDHEQFTGELFGGRALIPGHETVGVIVEIGADASARWRVTQGDRVAVEVFRSCGRCDPCRAGDDRRCERHGLQDMYGFVPIDRSPGLWGGYAEMQYLAPDTKVVAVPDGIDPTVATLFNPLGAGIRWAVTLPGTAAGDVVAVLGPGIRGLASLVAAKAVGAGFVMVTGHGERDRSRLETARRFGADLVVDVATDDPVERLRAACGRPADVVVDVTAKAPAALGQAVDLAAAGGTVVVAGTKGSRATPGFSPDAVVMKELHIVGALGVDTASYEEAFRLLGSGRYPFGELDRSAVGFDGLGSLLASMAGENDRVPPLHGVLVPDQNG
jgi:alcohol dehydrogenase